MDAQSVKALVDAKFDKAAQLARDIWNYAELPYEEEKSAAALIAALEPVSYTHLDVYKRQILLQLLEDGRLTDAQGRKTDFRNTIVICTSNIGARLLTEGPRIVGFDVTQDSAARSVHEAVLAELKSTLRPELLNRMDEIVVFQRLDDDALLRIAALLCGRVAERVSKAGLTLRVDDSALRFLIADGADPLYGARPPVSYTHLCPRRAPR